MRKERINEIWGVVSMLFGLFTLASLAFFQIDDLGFYTSHPNLPVNNYTGPIGAYLAHGLTVSFGIASYLIPFIFLIWSWCFFCQRVPERKIFKFVGLVITLIAASVFVGISVYPEKRFLSSGGVGYVLSTELLRYFGPVGSYIVAGSCLLLAVLLATDFLIFPVVKVFWRNLKGWGAKAFNAAQFVLEWVRTLKGKVRSPKPRSATTELAEKTRMILSGEPIIRRDLPLVKEKTEKVQKDSEKENRAKETKGNLSEIVEVKVTKLSVPQAPPEVSKERGPEAPPAQAILKAPRTADRQYRLPTPDILRKPEAVIIQGDDLRQQSRTVEETLSEFGIESKVVEVEQGPVITRFELLPAPGVKVTRILSLSDDLALALKATSLRFIAPIPGKSAIGIEIPNSISRVVYLREMIESSEFKKGGLQLPLVIGKDTSGKPLIADLAQMPHLLIAGTTGSGKTICVNSIIAGLLYHSAPDRVRFVMVDPKMVELAVYNSIPHMLSPVVTEVKKAAATLQWVVAEMDNRYRLFASRGVRNIQGFNAQSEESLPYIVVIIDELADLMMVAQDKVEGAIARLAQLSRAVGIHLILATQRPSVDVITGVIKANFPARISFKVASKVDSRTVLDLNGADKLLGRGDLLFLQPGEAKLIRGQGAFVVDEEIARVVKFVSEQMAPEYHPEISTIQESKESAANQEKDELFDEALRIVLETGVASASTLQRRLRLGYTRAARIVDQLEADGIVGPHRGAKPREILIDRAEALRGATSQETPA